MAEIEYASMAELVDTPNLVNVTTVEFSLAGCRAGKKRQKIKYAGMAELADAPDLGSVTTVEFFLLLPSKLKSAEN